MAIDPVCKMEVEEKNSSSSSHAGKAYHFCCPSCKAMFEKNPDKYI